MFSNMQGNRNFTFDSFFLLTPSIRLKTQRKIQGLENGNPQARDCGKPQNKAEGRVPVTAVQQARTTIRAGRNRTTPRSCSKTGGGAELIIYML